jgi:hypothetical protein
MCKHSERCALYGIRSNFGDVAACTTAYASQCRSEAVAPGTGMTFVSLNRCANYALGAACTDFDAPEDCAPQAGSRADGATCMYDSQCAGRHCTRSIPGIPCGICSREPGFGEPCTQNCDHGLECIDGTCGRAPLLGMACSAQLECAGSLRCVAPGVCAPSLGLGEPCESFSLYQCDLSQGLECNKNTHTCAPYNQLAGPGEPCGAATASFPRTGCLAGGSCPTTSNDAGVRTCVARIKEGDPCGSSAPAGASCAYPTTCKSGVCTVPLATDCD